MTLTHTHAHAPHALLPSGILLFYMPAVCIKLLVLKLIFSRFIAQINTKSTSFWQLIIASTYYMHVCTVQTCVCIMHTDAFPYSYWFFQTTCNKMNSNIKHIRAKSTHTIAFLCVRRMALYLSPLFLHRSKWFSNLIAPYPNCFVQMIINCLNRPLKKYCE